LAAAWCDTLHVTFIRRHPGWLLAIGSWIMLALFGAVQTYLAMITHGHSFLRLAFYDCVVWGIWLAFTPLVAWLARTLPIVPFNRRNALAHVLCAMVLANLHTILWLWAEIIIRPFDAMGLDAFPTWATAVLFARLTFEMALYAGILGMAYTVSLYTRSAELESSLSRARLHALELQLQPHFLFNTLHAIASLVRTERNNEAVEMIAALSDLLRYTLDHEGSHEVPLDRELSVLNRYLEIQRRRFPDRLGVRLRIDDDARRAGVPPLLLQPLAENAIRHGVARSAAESILEIRATHEGDSLVIEMFNSGTLDPSATRGIGLTNTAERLQQLYGTHQTFELHACEGGVVARVTVPWREVAA
jgi:two-component system, LytTR family, sensor kinase